MRNEKRSQYLNLDNPIFIVYVNVNGLHSHASNELIENYRKFLKYENCTFWIVAVTDQKTNFKMIWKGKNYEINLTFDSEKSIKFLKERISKLIDILSETSDEILKQKLRDFNLDQILQDE